MKIVLLLCLFIIGSSHGVNTIAGIQNGYTTYLNTGNSYKVLADKRRNWNDARSKCAALGGQLASISSSNEWEFVKVLLEESGISNQIKQYSAENTVWLGGSDPTLKNEWKWTNGCSVNYTDWYNGEPSTKTDPAWACMFASQLSSWKWKRGTCQYLLFAVCELPGCSRICKEGFTKYPSTDNSQLEPCRCGLAQRMNRIIGGEYTEPNEYPWMVRLLFTNLEYCGGSLITNQWILTAAHCFDDDDELKEVYLGDHDQTISEFNEVKLTHEDVVIHPNYNEVFNNNDYALVKIKPLNFEDNPNIRPICLPQLYNNRYPKYDRNFVLATGWGNTIPNKKSPSDKLREVKLQIMSNEDCKKTASKMCAVPSGKKDTCTNDSGGPLMLTNGDGVTPGQNYEIIGITSYGPYPCANERDPGVYARVTEAMPWIINITSGSQTCPRY